MCAWEHVWQYQVLDICSGGSPPRSGPGCHWAASHGAVVLLVEVLASLSGYAPQEYHWHTTKMIMLNDVTCIMFSVISTDPFHGFYTCIGRTCPIYKYQSGFSCTLCRFQFVHFIYSKAAETTTPLLLNWPGFCCTRAENWSVLTSSFSRSESKWYLDKRGQFDLVRRQFPEYLGHFSVCKGQATNQNSSSVSLPILKK